MYCLAPLSPLKVRAIPHPVTGSTTITNEAPVIDILSAVSSHPAGAHARVCTAYYTVRACRYTTCKNPPVLESTRCSRTRFLSTSPHPPTHTHTHTQRHTPPIQRRLRISDGSPFAVTTPRARRRREARPFVPRLMCTQIRCGPTCIHHHLATAHQSPAAMKND